MAKETPSKEPAIEEAKPALNPSVQLDASEDSTAGLDLVDTLHSPIDEKHRLEVGAEVECSIAGRDGQGKASVLSIHSNRARLNCRAKILSRTKAFNRYSAELTFEPNAAK